jgi:cell pole-organizing protein PopZ
MAKASQAAEPSMEEILASIRRIISDEEEPGNDSNDAPQASNLEDNPVEIEAADDMGDGSEMSQDDLDKLFDMDDGGDDTTDITADDDVDDMAAAMAEAEADEAEEDDVLELTEELAVDESDVGAVEDMADALVDNDIAFVEQPEADDEPDLEGIAAAMETPEVEMQTASVPDFDLPDVEKDGPLTSDQTGEAVHAAFDNLSHMFVGGNAQTVEELVREMLRPMLKAWLDQNLPGMVQEMVQKEIQRVTRRR